MDDVIKAVEDGAGKKTFAQLRKAHVPHLMSIVGVVGIGYQGYSTLGSLEQGYKYLAKVKASGKKLSQQEVTELYVNMVIGDSTKGMSGGMPERLALPAIGYHQLKQSWNSTPKPQETTWGSVMKSAGQAWNDLINGANKWRNAGDEKK